MKKVLLLSLLISSFAFGQNTTLGEYVYMTKGLRVQIENGLDNKKGYELKKIYRTDVDAYKFTFTLLVRESNPQELAGIIVFAVSDISGRDYLRAIPLGDPEEPISPLFTKYNESISDWDERMTTAYSMALTNFFTSLLFEGNISKDLLKVKEIGKVGI